VGGKLVDDARAGEVTFFSNDCSRLLGGRQVLVRDGVAINCGIAA